MGLRNYLFNFIAHTGQFWFMVLIFAFPFLSQANSKLCRDSVSEKQAQLVSSSESIRKQFPTLFEKIQRASDVIVNLKDYEKPYRSLILTFAHEYRTNKSNLTKQDFEKVSDQYKELVWEMYTRLTDLNQIAEYYQNLLIDSAMFVVQLKNQKHLDQLQQGKIPRFAILKTLALRHKERGLRLAKLKSSDDTSFFLAVANGSYYDAVFKKSNNIGHGSETHWIQMDFLNTTISRLTQNQNADFWKYIAGTPEGQNVWRMIFDSFNRDFTNPEFLNSTLNEAFPYADNIIDRESTFQK